MKLVLQQFLTLDGVSQGPGSPEEDTTDGFTAGGWFVPFLDEALMARVAQWATQADAFLFGARTYRNFARDWPAMDDPADPIASALNRLPKYVASRTLERPTWSPTTVIRGDVVGEVARLKELPGRELQIHGSSLLAASLLTAGLVDELRLAVTPVVLGQGRRLFAGFTGQPAGWKQVSSEATPAGLSILVYERLDAARFGVYSPPSRSTSAASSGTSRS